MSRSICIVFVALAIFQCAFAINVEPDKIITLDLTRQSSLSIDSFDGDSPIEFTGDLEMGDPSECSYYLIIADEFENTKSEILHVPLNIFHAPGNKIKYVSAVNKAGSTATFCGDESTLGTNLVKMTGRFPPNSTSTIIISAAWP